MKDIDFDELDKAVTSLMGGVPKNSDVPRPDDGIKTLVLNPTQPLPSAEPATVTDKPEAADVSTETTDERSAEHADEAPAPIAETVPSVQIAPRPAPVTSRQAPSLATRRGGRFMDVMHPSSDMSKTTPAPVTRHSGSIEPLNPTVTPDEPVTTVPAAAAEAPIAMEDIEPTSEWPDPLDLATADEVLQPNTEVTEPSTNEVDVADQPEPLVSPFLPDAKVEKRPLGSPLQDTPRDVPVVEPQPVVETPATTPVESVVLPEELQGDLMAIESGQADSPVLGATGESETPVVPQAAPAVAPARLVAQPTGPSSIPQQYKESPSTGDTTNGAIYDTDAYHQPLQAPAKKKPSWLWIVWVAILLVVGAGGGALAYIFLLK